MKNIKLLLFCFSLLLTGISLAQTKTILGTVSSKSDKQLLPGVGIIIKGTNKGTETDFDGKYTIKASVGDVLMFSFVGMKTISKPITGNTSTINVQLQDGNVLTEVVVTALGIKKSAKKLGYLVQEVDKKSLTQASDPNIATALRGKLAGVEIQSGATGIGSSTNINIRGINSLSGNNQPLIVIDGVIVNNTKIGQGNFIGGFDYGDGLSNLNPNDIQSVSILKGGNASAIYGYLGANGVILITTKRGNTDKARVEITSSLSLQNVLVSPKFQNKYGQGIFNTDKNALEYSIKEGGSWGPLLDGSQKERFDGQGMAKYTANPNDFKNFYDTGITALNSIIVSQAKDGFNYKLSYAKLDNNSIQRGMTLKKHNFGIKAGINITDKIKVSAKLDYTNQKGENRPELTDGQSNTVKSLSLKPRNISNNLLKNNFLTKEGLPNNWSGSFIMNPYYATNILLNEDETQRYIGLVSIEAELFKGLKLNARISQDISNTNAFIYKRHGAFANATNGKLDEFNTTSKLNNYDLLFNYNINLNDDITLGAIFGLNRLNNTFKSIVNTGETFVQKNIFSFNNFKSKNIIPSLIRTKSNSAYGSLSLGYKNYLFGEFTARNDWSSTLPIENASFFYPSFGLSFVASEAFLSLFNNSILSYLKIRGGYAKLGNATEAYALQNVYRASSAKYNNQLFSFFGVNEEGAAAGPLLRNPNLVAEISSSFETGLDFHLFNDRLRVNGTYYSKNTTNQILKLSLVPSSGASSKFINAGLISNKGIEFSLSGDIIKNDNFTWTSTINFSKNDNKIEELAQGADVQIRVRQFDDIVQVGAKAGESLWTLFGSTFKRDDKGNIIYDTDGLPMKGRIDKIGTTNPNALANFKNTFTYKNISLSVLLDAKFGGQVFSFSDLNRANSGTDIKTLQGREYFTGGNGIQVPQGSIIQDGKGKIATLKPIVATRGVNPQLYWGRLSQISENWVSDASFIKLREVSLSYNFTGKILKRLKLSKLSLSYVGRNLAILQKNTDNFDPETSFNTDYSGVEYFGFPSTSNHGLKLSIAF